MRYEAELTVLLCTLHAYRDSQQTRELTYIGNIKKYLLLRWDISISRWRLVFSVRACIYEGDIACFGRMHNAAR